MKVHQPLSILRFERYSVIFILYTLQPIFQISHSKMSRRLPDLPTLIFPRTAILTLGMFVISSVFMLVILVVYRQAGPLKINEHKLYFIGSLLSLSLSVCLSLPLSLSRSVSLCLCLSLSLSLSLYFSYLFLSLVTQRKWRRLFRTSVHIIA